MREFAWHEPSTISEACHLLAEHGDAARAVAGGTALVLALRQRLVTPAHLVSLARLDEGLRGIDIDAAGQLRIGALATHAEIARSPAVRSAAPMLADLAARMANPQVRCQGTIGGNLCYADPATDPPACLIALGAQVVLKGPRATRTLPLAAFIVDYATTALEADELLVELRIPPIGAGTSARYERHLRTAAEHRPLVNFAVLWKQDAGVCADVRLVIGASTAIPQRLTRAEECLRGRRATAALLAEAAQAAAGEIDPIDDARGSAPYRREIVQVLVRRSLARLLHIEEATT